MYQNWKTEKTSVDWEEYAKVADWCNESKEYHIEDMGDCYQVVKTEIEPLTNDEIKQIRASLYQELVDPITAHIQRLKDENPVPEGEIAELIAERTAKVEEIKERYPYRIDNEKNQAYNSAELTL